MGRAISTNHPSPVYRTLASDPTGFTLSSGTHAPSSASQCWGVREPACPGLRIMRSKAWGSVALSANRTRNRSTGASSLSSNVSSGTNALRYHRSPSCHVETVPSCVKPRGPSFRQVTFACSTPSTGRSTPSTGWDAATGASITSRSWTGTVNVLCPPAVATTPTVMNEAACDRSRVALNVEPCRPASNTAVTGCSKTGASLMPSTSSARSGPETVLPADFSVAIGARMGPPALFSYVFWPPRSTLRMYSCS